VYSIHQFPLDERHGADAIWLRLAELASTWLDQQGLAARDAVLLLPFAQHLAPARRAWMQRSRWQPRIETTHSLASALGPSPLPQALQISFDAAIDALAARQLLQGQSWAQALRASDARAYELSVQRLVEAAHALARGAAQQAPAGRAAFWTRGREALQQAGGPGGLERALALVALEWAAADARSPATDALFELRPSAWLHLQCGGADPLAEALLAHAQAQGLPVLRMSADLLLDEVFARTPPLGRLEQAVCEDFEDLAQCSASAVLQHLAAGRAPVALIAQDRVLLRRVRALLERQQVGMADETGWNLATTPPAAQLMALLRALRREASLDDWLAWLKTGLAASLGERAGSGALTGLEARCRAAGWAAPQALRVDKLAPASARLWLAARQALAPLQGGTARSLADWLAGLGEVLEGLGALPWLETQEAGPQLLDALWLRRQPWPGSAHEAVLQQGGLALADFVAWVDATLEAAQYVPPAAEQVQVLITPMARAMLRPFGAVVLPGADAQTLGPVPAGPALLGDALARQLGLPTLEDRRAAQALLFAQLLRTPALTLLRRRSQGAEPLAASPLLERLDLALQAGGHGALARWEDGRTLQTLQPRPVARAQAQAAGCLPAALSASAVESLRSCPYQFFARVLLGLREQAELEAQADKRDYGTWLHAVLDQFHRERLQAEGEALPDAVRLQRAAAQQMQALGLSAAEFLPFSASFARFVPLYLAWLAEQEAAGVHYAAGELEREVLPWAGEATLAGVKLRGRLDRIDVAPAARVLLDYKTGSVKGLKDKVAVPAEDTQLAVYAALMQGAEQPAGPAALEALYLALDDAKGIAAVPHPDVQDSAELLLWGLRQDLAALHEGAPLPALGEGMACAYCEMRGLCRRDDWTDLAL